MKHSKTPLRQEKQSFTHFMKGSEKWLNRICYFLAALIIGSGASYEPYRQEAIKKIAERELNDRMNDYDLE